MAVELGERFAAAGHALHLVGGSVRDALLGRLGEDLDFTTGARPEQVQAVLAGWAFPLAGNLKGYAQFFGGYGQSLIDYNYFQRSLGIGVLGLF